MEWGGGLAILGLKNKGGSKIAGGLHFTGGLDFEEGKALFWHWIVPMAGHFTFLTFNTQFSKKFTCSRLSPFSKNNLVNTVK